MSSAGWIDRLGALTELMTIFKREPGSTLAIAVRHFHPCDSFHEDLPLRRLKGFFRPRFMCVPYPCFTSGWARSL